nr:MAG TPA: hypothetical protein [Caudoviricetes sp.]
MRKVPDKRHFFAYFLKKHLTYGTPYDIIYT